MYVFGLLETNKNLTELVWAESVFHTDLCKRYPTPHASAYGFGINLLGVWATCWIQTKSSAWLLRGVYWEILRFWGNIVSLENNIEKDEKGTEQFKSIRVGVS